LEYCSYKCDLKFNFAHLNYFRIKELPLLVVFISVKTLQPNRVHVKCTLHVHCQLVMDVKIKI